MPIDIPGMRLIAQSENGFDNLFFDTAARNLLVCLKRENMICEIIQSFDAPASFDLEVLQYNGAEPHLSLTLGNYISILYLV